jgi:hypothetical protein
MLSSVAFIFRERVCGAARTEAKAPYFGTILARL